MYLRRLPLFFLSLLAATAAGAQQMPAPQRSALEMAYFEGYSHSEISQKTGEPLGTIKTRIRTGLLQLRKAVETR